jgi:uncharacterized protein with HEPN domain
VSGTAKLLSDALAACERIARMIDGRGVDEFATDLLLRSAVERN